MSQLSFARNALLRQVLPLLMSALLIACESESAPGPSAPPPPPTVSVQTVHAATININNTYPARTRGFREIEVRARVEGILLERLYNEGTVVDKGTMLFRIDPKPFQVALQRAQAQLASSHAKLRRAQRDWHRVQGLFDANAISARERDQALSTLELGQANVAIARAQVAQAKIDLGYTEVNAPLAGATSLEHLNEGSLVRPGDLLATITQLDPIYVLFSIPEDDAALRHEAMRAMTAGSQARARTVQVTLSNGERYKYKGIVNFTDSNIDRYTGTVQARAAFPNPHGGLVPGQFVRVSMRTRTLPNTIVVPEQAIATGPSGPVVYVVDGKNIARARSVKLGARVEGGQVITRGLKDNERIVVAGIVKVADGAKVTPEAAGNNSGSAA